MIGTFLCVRLGVVNYHAQPQATFLHTITTGNGMEERSLEIGEVLRGGGRR